ncbi:MAG TPA: cupin domain-containing protein [Nitrososphaeraceae archaeon]|nr:cupin domain-containing protein [Nitrososphaeraceae archaeon]
MGNFKIFDLDICMSKISKSKYFMDILNTHTMEVGIIKLSKNQKDSQQPHESDEIYYVISGNGKIVINKNEYDVKPGNIIYIPKNTSHHFQTINENELIILYIIA